MADHPADDPSDPDTAPPPECDQLLGNETAEYYRRLVTRGVDLVADQIASTERPATGVGVPELAQAVDDVDLERPVDDSESALEELERLYLRDAVYFHHPRYLAHLNCPVAIPALLGEAILSSVNSSLDTWDQSVGGTLIERRLIAWTADRLGLGDGADGVFTSGGTQSNLQALLIAREEAFRQAQKDAQRESGHAASSHRAQPPRLDEVLPRLRVFTSSCSHFSVRKACSLLGLGPDAVIEVPCDAQRRMCPVALAIELERCARDGLLPMAVVATAGTTDFGSIDPLDEIADLCAESGAWLHVDAAYGCGLLVSRHRHLLSGIERADSVTADFHKAFFQPVSSSAVLVRDRESLRHVTYHADYLNPERQVGRVPNQVDLSLQTTRRFDALKLWLTLRMMGADAVGSLFDSVIDLARRAWRLLDEDPRFEVLVRPELSTVVFRWNPPDAAHDDERDRANLHAREALFGTGEAIVASTVVDGQHYLKLTLLNPRTSVRDLREVLDLIAWHAPRYADTTAGNPRLAGAEAR